MSDEDQPDWYLQEWATVRKKKQAQLVSELGWHKNTAHLIWHSKQPYRRDVLNQVSAWLGIKPYELLMPPSEALALQRLRQVAAAIVSEEGGEFEHDRPSTAPSRGASKKQA